MTIHDLDNEAHDGVGCAHEDSYWHRDLGIYLQLSDASRLL